MDLSSGIKITPVYVDASPRCAVDTHYGSGDQNCTSPAAEMMANDSSDGETDIDLSIVGKSLQKQQDEPH